MAATPRRGRGKAGDLIAGAADRPLVVSGDPKRLAVTVPLHNEGGEAVAVESVVLRDREGSLGLSSAVVRRGPAVALQPDAEASVRLPLKLDPHTPPGEYHAEVDVAGATREVVVLVAEKTSVRLRPRRIVVAAEPGGTTSSAVIVTNRGNVAVTLDDIGAVPLDDEQRDCRILRRTAEALTAEGGEVTVERLLTEFTHASKQVLDETGLLRVRVRSDAAEVAPGATARVELDITLPATLDPHSRYVAFAPFATRTLTFVVAPGRPAAAPPKTTRRRAAPATKRAPAGGGSRRSSSRS